MVFKNCLINEVFPTGQRLIIPAAGKFPKYLFNVWMYFLCIYLTVIFQMLFEISGIKKNKLPKYFKGKSYLI